MALGGNNYQEGWLRDNIGNNISQKNKYYGEYSFHYWIWKIKWILLMIMIGLDLHIEDFWSNEKELTNTGLSFKNKILKEAPEIWNNYDVILANKVTMENIKLIKIIKYGKLALLNNPKSIFKKEEI